MVNGRDAGKGRFREDLFYRLSVVRIYMPPLRKRKEDIETITDYLLAGISSEISKKVSGLSPEAAAALMAYSWPGNVRELKNVLGRAAALSDGGKIETKDLVLPKGRKQPLSKACAAGHWKKSKNRDPRHAQSSIREQDRGNKDARYRVFNTV